jgi:hypothetical protein
MRLEILPTQIGTEKTLLDGDEVEAVVKLTQ